MAEMKEHLKEGAELDDTEIAEKEKLLDAYENGRRLLLTTMESVKAAAKESASAKARATAKTKAAAKDNVAPTESPVTPPQPPA